MKQCWLQIFFVQIFSFVCLCYSFSFWSDPNIDNKDLTWVVEIFTLPSNKSRSVEAVYSCAGVLIHPRAVLTTRLCIPDDNFSQNVTVRVYDWSKKSGDNMIQEEYVSKSFYELYYDTAAFRVNISHFTTLILENPFTMSSQISYTDSYKLDTIVDDTCIYLDERIEKKSGAITRKQLWLMYLPETKCCEYFGEWTIPIVKQSLEYNCTKHGSTFCFQSYSPRCSIQARQGTPLLCPSTHDGSYTLAGLLVASSDCYYEFGKIKDMQKFINKALANITL